MILGVLNCVILIVSLSHGCLTVRIVMQICKCVLQFVMKVVLLLSVFVYVSISKLLPHLKAHFCYFRPVRCQDTAVVPHSETKCVILTVQDVMTHYSTRYKRFHVCH